jgi:hypothetical protein
MAMRAIASLLLAVLIVSLLGPASLYAGAWTQDSGHGQIILTASFFQTSRNLDDRGFSTRFSDNASFRQLMLNPFLDYAMSRRNTLVVNANVPFLLYASSQRISRSAGLGDVEIGIKRRLNSLESKWALSGQLAVMFPVKPLSKFYRTRVRCGQQENAILQSPWEVEVLRVMRAIYGGSAYLLASTPSRTELAYCSVSLLTLIGLVLALL